jgi:hypothetical protein
MYFRSCIHKIPFARLSGSSASHSPSSVTALAQSPAIDVLGVGFASGEISIYDIRADEKMMRIFVREGPVRALAFRGGKRGLKHLQFHETLILCRRSPSSGLCLGNGTYISVGSRLWRAFVTYGTGCPRRQYICTAMDPRPATAH